MRIDEEKAAVEAKLEPGKYPKEKQNTFKTFQRCHPSPREKKFDEKCDKIGANFSS